MNAFPMIATGARLQSNPSIHGTCPNLCSCGALKWIYHSRCALCQIKADEGSG
jgi:hypothetical protein